jgi:ketosteroid isomerase-like protein
MDADIAVLEDLNANYVRSAEEGDVAWYSKHLAADFLASNVDGSIIDKPAFLERMTRRYPGSDLEALDVLGEVALIHAGFRYRKPDGADGSGRYTDIWARRDGRWLCVSAHFNRF